MRKILLNGKEVKIMREFDDEKYGKVWRVYLDDRKTYAIEGELTEDKEIINELDNKYGIPQKARGMIFTEISYEK